MILRPATPADLLACMAVDASYRTQQAWQMRVLRGGGLGGEVEEAIQVTFRSVRLPRPAMLTPPNLKERLSAGWQRRDLTLVLEEAGLVQGYLGMEVRSGPPLGWIDLLVLAPEVRQQGWEERLVEEAIAWGQARGLRAIVLETQARNMPQITLAQQMGFAFSGYHEDQYDEEVALFFTLPLGGGRAADF